MWTESCIAYSDLALTDLTDPWCNMLQTLQVSKNIGDKKLSAERARE